MGLKLSFFLIFLLFMLDVITLYVITILYNASVSYLVVPGEHDGLGK